MDKKGIILGALFICVVMTINGCQESDKSVTKLAPGPDAQTEIQDAFIEAEEGDILEFEAGTYKFLRPLTMDSKKQITLRGQGREETILSFSKQMTGGEALLITNSSNILVQDLTIRDAQGDALKFKDSDDVTMLRVGTVWSGEPSSKNGAYGLYPVTSRNILIDSCYAFGASDAGIYVGQSDKAIVRNSTAEGNVAGIEIENTTNADVYNNVVRNNTGGILVFDLPDLTQSGARTRVFDNIIQDNNHPNFALEGAIVSHVPAGTGVLVLSTSEVEIFNNTIKANNTMGTGVFNYLSLVALGATEEIQDSTFNPYYQNIYIHDNMYNRSGVPKVPAEEQTLFEGVLLDIFDTEIPDIIVDGFFASRTDSTGSVCIQNNSGAGFVNLNISDDFPNNLRFDASPHACSQDPLQPVTIDAPGTETS